MLEIAALALQLLGFGVYFYFISRGYTEPNIFALFSIACVAAAAGYGAFAVLMSLLVTYAILGYAYSPRYVSGQLTTALLCAMCALAAFVTPKPLWISLRPLLVIALGLAFYPVFVAVRRFSTSEHPLPWFAWTASFALFSASQLLQGSGVFVRTFPVLVSAACLYVTVVSMLQGRARATLL